MPRKTARTDKVDETADDVVTLPTDRENGEPELGSAREQFPAVFGEPETEVAHRSADGAQGNDYHKTFVVLGPVGEDHPMHEDNRVRTHEEAIQRGLHPKGEARLVGTKEVPEVRGQVSTELTYAVEVLPASVDHEANETVTPRDVVEDGNDENQD